MSRTPTPVAQSVPFDNATNSFVATNVQGAIEEAKNAATIGFDENKLLTSAQHELLVDMNGNVLRGS